MWMCSAALNLGFRYMLRQLRLPIDKIVVHVLRSLHEKQYDKALIISPTACFNLNGLASSLFFLLTVFIDLDYDRCRNLANVGFFVIEC